MAKERVYHGLTSNKEHHKCYRAWIDIRRRCYETEHEEYFRYGARGIGLQDSWRDDPKLFCDYLITLEHFSLDRSLDRIDNDLGYCEGNLRWATKAEQVRNRSKNRNNTSGTCGVTWYCNKTGGTRAIAWWADLKGKTKSKSFPVKKFGLIPAYRMACMYRQDMINKLNSQGAGYSESHGK